MRFIRQLSSILMQTFARWNSTTVHTNSRYKRTNPSATRNSQPIAEALCAQVDLQSPHLRLLEIASGCGQHCGYLAPMLPHIIFQPTEYDSTNFSSISAYADACATHNICKPLFVDIAEEPAKWQHALDLPPATLDYMLNINMVHISPWACSVGLFRAAGTLLKPRGLLFTYGPYAVHGVLTPESNINFDKMLRSQNSEWGVRDVADLKQLATENGITLQQTQEMPSNNKFLTWIKH